MDRIAEQFKTYQEQVIPRDASAIQLNETRRAFFAGAQAMITICKAIGTDYVSEQEGAQIMEDADQELQLFCVGVSEGRN